MSFDNIVFFIAGLLTGAALVAFLLTLVHYLVFVP
jgi:hypothetical protein